MSALRTWLADRLAHAAWRLYALAEHVRPAYIGPLCPDCQIAPDLGPDGECPECLDRYRQQKADEAIYGAGYETAMHDTRNEVPW